MDFTLSSNPGDYNLMGITTLYFDHCDSSSWFWIQFIHYLTLEFGIGEEDMRILKDLFKDYRFTIGFIVLCLLVFLAIASFFSPYDPIEWLQVLGIDLLRGLTLGTIQRPRCLLGSHLCHKKFVCYRPDCRITLEDCCYLSGIHLRIQGRPHRQNSYGNF